MLYKPLLPEKVLGHVLGVLALYVHPAVKLADGVDVQDLRDGVEDLLHLRVFFEHIVTDHWGGVVERPDVLLVLQHYQLLGGELPVGQEAHATSASPFSTPWYLRPRSFATIVSSNSSSPG